MSPLKFADYDPVPDSQQIFRVGGFTFFSPGRQGKLYIGAHFTKTITVIPLMCRKAHFVMKIYQQSFLPWLSSLWHITTLNFTLNEGHSFSYTETLVVDQRHLHLNMPFAQDQSCSLKVEINPKVNLPGDQVKHSYAKLGELGDNAV